MPGTCSICLGVGRQQRVHRAEVLGERARVHVADAGDAERVEDAHEGLLPSRRRSPPPGSGRHLAEAVQLARAARRRARRCRPRSAIRPSLRKRRTFSSPRPSMSIAPTKCLTAWKSWPGQEARLGQIVQTPSSGLMVGVPQAGHLAGGFGRRARFLRLLRLGRRRHHLRDHVAGAHDDHLVALAHVLAAQVLLVVERGELHGHARHLHRLELRERDHVAGPAHVPGDPLELGGGRARRELPGDRPARLAADHAELALQLEVVDLDHHAVDLEVEPVAALLPGVAGGDDCVEVVVHLDVRVHPEAVLAQPLERLGLRASNSSPSSAPIAVAPHRQRPRGRELRVELADRAGGRVARVREGRLARPRRAAR